MTYCISDIHGEYELFLDLMDKVGFCTGDRLLVLGDVIDKGRDSVRLLRALFAQPNCRVILGNHEYDFLKFYWGAMRQTEGDYDGVLRKLRGYFPEDGKLLTWELMDALEGLASYLEEEDFLAVHAGIPIGLDGRTVSPGSATVEQLVYDRNFKDPATVPVASKCVVYGHTPVRYLTNRNELIFYPRSERRTGSITDFYKIHIDTGVYLSGVLGCLRVDDCTPFYVSKRPR